MQGLKVKNDRYIIFELGKLEAKCGNFDKAREYFKSIIDTSSKYMALFELGKLEMSLNNMDLAREYFHKIIEEKYDKYTLLELGRLEARLGNIKLAKKYYYSILNREYDTYSLTELGLLELQDGSLEKAKEYFITANKSYNKIALTKLAQIETECRNLEKAKEYLNLVLEKENDDGALYDLGVIEMMLGNAEKARNCFQKLIFKNYNYHSAYNLLCILEFKMQNYLDAIKLINNRGNREVNERVILSLSKEFNIFFNFDYEMFSNKKYDAVLDYDEDDLF